MTQKFFQFSRIQETWESRSEPESMRVIVSVFWHALLVLAFILFLLTLWIGSQELGTVSQAEIPIAVSSAVPAPWSPAQLQGTLDVFSQRQSAYQALAGSPLPSVVDPSK